MPFGPASRNLNQAITYWAPASTNKYGESLFGDAPILLYGRWMIKTQIVENASGNNITTNAEVFLTGDVEELGFLAEGDYVTPNIAVEPNCPVLNPHLLPTSVVSQIKSFVSQPDLRNMERERRAYV